MSLCNNINYGFKNKWIIFIKRRLDNCGMTTVWVNQQTFDKKWTAYCIEQKLKEQFYQEWCAEVNVSSKGLYKIFKDEIIFEK